MESLTVRIFKVALIVTASLIVGVILGKLDSPKIDLPEEYKAIILEDNLIGYYDKYGVLHIYFNSHNPKFVWNDNEESIPMVGKKVTIELVENGTIYLGN